ncbi:MAG: hypothetical protein R2875_03610 [Desulfobacterales bacterium]
MKKPSPPPQRIISQSTQVKIDSRIDFDMISDALVDEISSLAPFGEDNPEPLFCAEHVVVAFSKVMGSKHSV